MWKFPSFSMVFKILIIKILLLEYILLCFLQVKLLQLILWHLVSWNLLFRKINVEFFDCFIKISLLTKSTKSIAIRLRGLIYSFFYVSCRHMNHNLLICYQVESKSQNSKSCRDVQRPFQTSSPRQPYWSVHFTNMIYRWCLKSSTPYMISSLYSTTSRKIRSN